MKVIHVTPVYLPAWQYGGTVRAIHGMTTALAAQGHDVEVVSTTIGTPYATSHEMHKTMIDGVRVTYVPGWVRWGGAVAPRLPGEVLKQATEDSVVHISSGWQPGFRAMFTGLRRRERSYAYSPHGSFSPEVFAKGRLKKAAYYRLCERSHLRNAAAVVATSEMEAADLLRLDSSLSVKVLPNMCDATLWAPAKAESLPWRHRLAIAADDIVILQVCRPDPIKNTAFLVDALRGVAPGRNYVLVIMGPGHSKLPTESLLPSHVQIRRVEGSKDISTLRAAYSAAQVVAVPSIYECFGNVVIEAALCGATVVASPRVGAATLPEFSAAVKILPLDVSTWSRAIQEAPGIDLAGNVLSRAASAAAVSPDRIGMTLTEVYKQMLSDAATYRPSA